MQNQHMHMEEHIGIKIIQSIFRLIEFLKN